MTRFITCSTEYKGQMVFSIELWAEKQTFLSYKTSSKFLCKAFQNMSWKTVFFWEKIFVTNSENAMVGMMIF